jgi:hypothetical protein
MNDKKNRERLFIMEVAAIFPDFPSGTINDSERPDFLISSHSYVVGVEVVGYMRGQNRGESINRRNERLWQQVADMAKQKYERHHSEPLMVHFIWHSHRYPRKANIQQLTTSASAIIGQFIPQDLFERIRVSSDDLANTPLEEFLHSIHISRVRNDQQVLWSFVNSDFISLTVNEIQDLITSKNPKVPDYLLKCDKVWLLIVADGQNISSNVDVPEAVKQNTYSSSFEKVLFYDRLR